MNIITREELSKHNKSNDLWVEVYGLVYNVSKFLQDHPLAANVADIAGNPFPILHPNSNGVILLFPYQIGKLTENYLPHERSKEMGPDCLVGRLEGDVTPIGISLLYRYDRRNKELFYFQMLYLQVSQGSNLAYRTNICSPL